VRYLKELVSVLMSTYKEPVVWVEKAVNSILNQTYKNIEFVVIIDDPTNYEVIAFIESVCQKDNRVKLIKNEKNIGLVASLNKGLKFCDGKYIARMDADDISMLDRIEKQIIAIQRYCADVVGANTQTFTEQSVCKEKSFILPLGHVNKFYIGVIAVRIQLG
jgi:glycosyltransferase involved in cell wall biosynthesis